MARGLPCGWVNPPSPRRRRPFPRSLAGRIALGVLAVVIVVACTFDWNWFAPLIRHYVVSHSGRAITFDRVDVRFEHGLDPTIEFRNLTIQNAPWAASKAPFIHAGRAAGSVSWRSLGADMMVVYRIELEDAQLDMEQQADGLRNWRLGHPDDRGPAHVQVLSLDARRSSLHTIHHGIGLEMDVATVPLPAAEPFAQRPDLPLTRLLTFKGRLRDDAFEGTAHVSDILTFGATPQMFSFKLDATTGALRLLADGLTNNVRGLGDLDCDAKLTASGSGDAKPLPPALARLRPLMAQGHVNKSADHWVGAGVRLRAGRQTTLVADLDFVGSLKSDTPRRTLKATLRDAVIDVDDLSLLRGKTPPGEKTQPGLRADDDHALSAQPLPLARLRALDADVDLRPARFVGAERGLAQTLRAHATLANGLLQVRTFDAGIADGHVSGSARVDASRTPADVDVDVSARGLHIEQLSATLAASNALAGAIDGHAVVKARGDSARALARSAGGSVTLSLAAGATVSKRLDAKLGLNGGEWLRTLFDKSARVPVQCASATLALDKGVATPRRFVFETPDTALAAQGSLDLADETIDATLTPAHRKLALLSLDKSIHAEGSWHDVKISLKPPAGDPPARCATDAPR